MNDFLNEVTYVYYLLAGFINNYIYGHSSVETNISEGKILLDAIISSLWSLSSGALALVGIIGGLFSIGFQRQVESVQKAYEELFELKRYKDEYINLEYEQRLFASQSHIRKGFLKYQEKLQNIESEINLFCDDRFRKILLPLVILWISGMLLQIIRWCKYGPGDLGIGLLVVIQAVLLLVLFLIIKGVSTIVQSLKNMSKKLPSLNSMLDVGANGNIPSYELMLDPAIVTVSIPKYNIKNKIYFMVYYAVPFYNYKVSMELWFLDEQGNGIAKEDSEVEYERTCQEIESVDQGARDFFSFKIPDNATAFIIRRIRYEAPAKPYGLVVFNSTEGQISIKSVQEKDKKIIEVRQLWSNSPSQFLANNGS